jgi:hypothetical protein
LFVTTAQTVLLALAALYHGLPAVGSRRPSGAFAAGARRSFGAAGPQPLFRSE